MNDNQPRVYGELLAGGTINLGAFFRKPLVICRIASMFFSIIVFSTIISGAWHNDVCLLNKIDSNCNFVSFVGISFLIVCALYLCLDFALPHLVSLDTRKIIVIVDIAVSCLYTLFWLVSMGVIIGEWWRTVIYQSDQVPYWKFSCIQAAASFSIFSVAIMILLVYFSTRRFNMGKTQLFDMATHVNYADNVNFDGIPGGASGAVSGGANDPQMSNSTSQPYIISAKINGDSHPSNPSRVQVLY